MLIPHKTLSLAVVMNVATAATAAPPFAEIAPSNTIFIACVKSAEASCARFKRTDLWALWNSGEMQEIREVVDERIETGLDELTDALDMLDMEAGEMPLPTGEMGFAVAMVFNPELGMLEPVCLLSADYGEMADDAEKMIDGLRRHADEDDAITYEERDVRGRTVHAFTVSRPAPEPIDDIDDLDDIGMLGGGPAGTLEEALDTMFIVREGSRFFACTDMGTLSEVLERVDGEGDGALADREDFQGLMGQLGEHEMSAALLTRDLGTLAAGMDPMGIMMMVTPMLKQLVGTVQGIGIGCRLDGQNAMVEFDEVVYMPHGKVGLTALLTDSSPAGALPRFAGPDVINFTTLNFDFGGLPAALRPVIQFVQMMMRPEPGQAQAIDAMLEQVTSTLGRRLHVAQVMVDGMMQTIAVECAKPQELEHLLGEFAAARGIEGRDFRGHRIYTLSLPGGMIDAEDLMSEPPAIGLGGSFVFAGPVSGVERALRASGDAGNASLADEPTFARAMAALGGGQVVGWGYTDVCETFAASTTIAKQQLAGVVEALAREDSDVQLDEDQGRMRQEQLEDGMFGALDAEWLSRYLGPFTWKLEATDEGFRVRAFLLGASRED